jgi:hypothetical protein
MVELGTRCITERVHDGNSPPKTARTVFLPDPLFFPWKTENIESANDLTIQLINLPCGMPLCGPPVEDSTGANQRNLLFAN